ncbi:hypothetical protein [Flavobacterium sp.]|uniref:hypothetical protein n=1 Tax=Flavobacterium sp. TaxID=239 RepID=UPI0024887D0C|nr:hypothetical protein [Flavobacterium sp.]MDI1318281.1 hypothetical protein [Flavobacterium sp.]
MKKILLLFVLVSSVAFSQSINNYEYVIVPLKFADFKEPNKYNLNTNTKLLLQKYGFKAYMASDSIPNEISNASCRKLYADIVKENTLLNTKIKVVLKDCKDKVVYETALGESNEKERSRSYNEALREAGKSFDKLNYKYNGKNEIAIDQGQQKTKAIPQQLGENVSQIEVVKVDSESKNNSENFFFAQPIPNGFQIVNSEPKVILKMFNTSVKNIFIATKEAKSGVVLSKNNQWFFEYYENSKLVSEPLNLKF